jgi:hypothetical protein
MMLPRDRRVSLFEMMAGAGWLARMPGDEGQMSDPQALPARTANTWHQPATG